MLKGNQPLLISRKGSLKSSSDGVTYSILVSINPLTERKNALLLSSSFHPLIFLRLMPCACLPLFAMTLHFTSQNCHVKMFFEQKAILLMHSSFTSNTPHPQYALSSSAPLSVYITENPKLIPAFELSTNIYIYTSLLGSNSL